MKYVKGVQYLANDPWFASAAIVRNPSGRGGSGGIGVERSANRIANRRRTNQTQEAWVYSYVGPIRRRKRGYILGAGKGVGRDNTRVRLWTHKKPFFFLSLRRFCFSEHRSPA